jgi:hypothetical protein
VVRSATFEFVEERTERHEAGGGPNAIEHIIDAATMPGIGASQESNGVCAGIHAEDDGETA